MSRLSGARTFLLLGVACAAPQAPQSQNPEFSRLGPPLASPGSTSKADKQGGNLLKASTFGDGKSVPWAPSFTAPAAGEGGVEAGAYCVTVTDKGKDRWYAQFRHREMVIQKGHTYSISFKAWASAATLARPKVGMSGAPYAEYWASTIELEPKPKQFVGKFTMAAGDDPTAEFAFHVGGDLARAPVPFKICIDDVRLEDPDLVPGPPPEAEEPPRALAVNQLGYAPKTVKIATLRSSAPKAEAVELVDAQGSVLWKGQTKPFGKDAASGEAVHLIDFSAFREPQEGLTLRVGDVQSYPFDVSTTLYAKLKLDALAFFYHQRSGIPITLPYARDRALTRPAGHLSDKSVKCLPESGCDYALDVSRGWYDAGDHGKYVVNGGISVWTLLNLYERTEALGSSLADFADGKLAIPENSNSVPDLLDEARWELEFLLGMQVPEGKPLAGMAHHKIHDQGWTGLGTAPHEDTLKRWLSPPTTAATLNLAAVAAQGARVFKPIDAAFAARCSSAAERAYRAAGENPKRLAPPFDVTAGGGAYEDKEVGDDFYWAAAELYITTGKAEYLKALKASALDRRFPLSVDGQFSSMNWATTDALGMLSLAVAKGVPPALQKAQRARIIEAAQAYVRAAEKEGYRTLLPPNAEGQYVWGSNSFLLNNLIVVALAYDFSKQKQFLDGVVLGMDYLLGRNPLTQSYVTGYGERPLKNPHHRFWARQANPAYPGPPSGVVSGGPNSQLQDGYARGAGLVGCPPQKCFVDHIEAFSVNEVAINWNAPLAWVAAWLDERLR